jgi:hypothetical protein
METRQNFSFNKKLTAKTVHNDSISKLNSSSRLSAISHRNQKAHTTTSLNKPKKTFQVNKLFI